MQEIVRRFTMAKSAKKGQPRPNRMSAMHFAPIPAAQSDFTATHWTQVALAADQGGSVPAQQALEALCVRYWPAIYGFLRRKNHPPADAADLTQGFFAHLIEQNGIARADRSKGRFRSFLLGSLHRFLAGELRREGALKRGRDKEVLALDFKEIEKRYLDESDPALTADEIYDRRWATTLLEVAYRDLQAEFNAAGQADRFNELKRFLSEDAEEGEYDAIASRLSVTAKAISSAVSRLRARYRELVRRHVMVTVSSHEDVDPEFEDLFK